MARVPYNPVPQVQPTEQGLPGVQVSTPIDAFGGGTAAAVGHFGTVAEGVGNEIFGRALALQQLSNETEAREADAQYMLQSGDIYAKYGALQGKDRVDAYPKYRQDLDDLRTSIRNKLSNPMAQKMYDATSLSTMGRLIVHGAYQSATAQKEWSINTVKAQNDLDLKTVEDNPDEFTFQQKLGRIAGNAKQLAALQGIPEGSAPEKDLALKAQSQAWVSRIVGLSRTQPFAAAKMLDDNKTQMTESDYLHVDQIVRTQSRAVGATNIASKVYEDGRETPTQPAKSLSTMEQEAGDKAKEMNPDDPLLATHAISAVRQKYYFDKQSAAQTQHSNEQIVLQAIQAGVKNDQELLADPKVAAAFNALPPNSPLRRKPLNYQITQYNDLRDKQEMDNNFITLRGMAVNDPMSFLNTNINDKKLLPGQRSQIMSIRDKLIQHQGDDPRVWAAMRSLRGSHAIELQALGVYHRDPKNPDDYDHFTGALQTALDSYLESHSKPADAKAISDEIFPEIIRTIKEPGRLWGTNEVPFFRMSEHTPAFEDFSSKYVQMKKEFGITPTPEAIYRAYTRAQFQRLYGQSKH